MDFGSIVGTVAPIVGGYFGGAPGAAAGSAIGSMFTGASQAGAAGAAGRTAAGMADPFASQREQYATRLRSYAKSPEKFAEDYQTAPGYQFRLGEQNRAIERAFAQRGMARSGNLFEELMQRSGELASQEFASDWARRMQYTDLLSTLSGATTGSPSGAAQAYFQGQQAQAAGMEQVYGGAGALASILYPKEQGATYTPSTVGDIW